MSNRPAIPAGITREILLESGHRCAVCGTPCPLERAHIIPWHKSREHKAEDLICLCANCHERADKEKWGEKTLREYKRRPWVLRQYRTDKSNMDVTGFKDAGEATLESFMEKAQATKLDVLNALYQAYKVEPGEKVNSEQIRKTLGLSREQMNDIILALRERGFIEAEFVDARALLRITADGVAVLKS